MLTVACSGVPAIGSITVDPQTNDIYVTQLTNTYRIKKILTNGSSENFAGTGTSGKIDGVGTWASIGQIYSMTYCIFNGHFYFSENGYHLVRRMTTSAKISTIAGGLSNGRIKLHP